MNTSETRRPVSRRHFLQMTTAAIAGGAGALAVPNPNLFVSQSDIVKTAQAAPADASCGTTPYDRLFSNLTNNEQAAIQISVNRVTNIVDAAGRVVETKSDVPAVGNDYLIESVQNPAQRVVATIKDVNGIGVAKEIIRYRQPDGSFKGAVGTDTFVFNGSADGTARVRLLCDGQEQFKDVPGIQIRVSRFEKGPAKYIDIVTSAIRCNPLRQRFTSTINEPLPVAEPTRTPEPTPAPTPAPTPEKGNQSPVPSGNQSPLSETDPSLGEQYGLVAEMPEGEFIRVISN
jgi:hypothetical protein